MTTTPGYTVDALLREFQIVAYADQEPDVTVESLLAWMRSKFDAFDAAEFIANARAAELTQVTAQSVERASPAKDGGGQAGEVTVTTNKAGACVSVTRTDEDGQILSVIWEAPHPLQPLASQMRPQSAVENVDAQAIERGAKAIYEHWAYKTPPEYPWVPNGNSTTQDTAREFARAVIGALAAAPTPPTQAAEWWIEGEQR